MREQGQVAQLPDWDLPSTRLHLQPGQGLYARAWPVWSLGATGLTGPDSSGSVGASHLSRSVHTGCLSFLEETGASPAGCTGGFVGALVGWAVVTPEPRAPAGWCSPSNGHMETAKGPCGCSGEASPAGPGEGSPRRKIALN